VGGLSPQGYSMVRWVPYQRRKRFPYFVVASCSLILKHSSTGFHTCKECHKTDSLEIIPLQTTRKEKNLKTEEALERAVVTLKTERIKGFNP